MFSLSKPSEATIRRTLELARECPMNYGLDFNTRGDAGSMIVPHRFVRDHTRSEIGHGGNAFEAAKAAFRQWKQFDLGWVRVANPEARIEAEDLVAMEAHTAVVWSLNITRILYVIDEPERFGFGYGTTTMHVERGEERFLLEYYPVSGIVAYSLQAVSQPAHWLTRIGNVYARSRQKKFARESHARMREIVGDIT